MNSFVFNDAIRFKLATQQEDTGAKVQVFLGVFIGVLLRWVYAVAVIVIRNNSPWCFGDWKTILIHLAGGISCDHFCLFGLLGAGEG